MDDWRYVIPDGLAWNEAQLERGDPLNRGLLSLLVIKDDLHIDLIGTGFIVQSNKNHALAVSAAHCFEAVRTILHPNPLHHSSALPEFLPPPSAVDLKHVKCLYFDGYKPLLCDLELAAWDQDSDYALCIVKAPPFHDSLFDHELWLDDQIPLVGDQVAMIGIGEMQFIPNIDPVNFGTIKRRVVLRVGHVESVHLEGHYMLKVPYVQTSIVVFPGMSGGIVARWTGPNTQIQPFGFISHSPTPPTYSPTYNDRSISGQSIGVILNMKRTIISEKKQQVAIQIKHDGIGLGDLSAPRVINQHYGDVIMKNEQKPHLIAVQALLCDDVRHEFNGKQIIIGVYGDNILVPSLPTSITLCLWMRFKAPSAGAYVIDWSVIGARLQQLAPVQSINVDVKDSTGHVDVNVKSTLNINEPEVLRFQWRDNGGEWKEALSIEMGLQPTPVTISVSQPPS